MDRRKKMGQNAFLLSLARDHVLRFAGSVSSIAVSRTVHRMSHRY